MEPLQLDEFWYDMNEKHFPLNNNNNNNSEEEQPFLSEDWFQQLHMFDLPNFLFAEENNNNNNNNNNSILSPYSSPSPTSSSSDNNNNNEDIISSNNYNNNSNNYNVYNNNNNNNNNLFLNNNNNVGSIHNVITEDKQHLFPGPFRNSDTNTNTNTTTTADTNTNSNTTSSNNMNTSTNNSSLISKPTTNSHGKSAVTLSRDQLLSFTSEDMDNFERNITTTRPLTPAERKEMKRQRRLIKNRESAQLSRRRKKDRVDQLEQIVGDLDAKNKTVNAKLQELEAQNIILKAEVSQLMGVIRDSPILSKLLNNVTSMLVYNAMQASEAKKITSLITPLQSPQNSIAAC